MVRTNRPVRLPLSPLNDRRLGPVFLKTLTSQTSALVDPTVSVAAMVLPVISASKVPRAAGILLVKKTMIPPVFGSVCSNVARVVVTFPLVGAVLPVDSSSIDDPRVVALSARESIMLDARLNRVTVTCIPSPLLRTALPAALAVLTKSAVVLPSVANCPGPDPPYFSRSLLT